MPRKRDPNKPVGPTPLVLDGEEKARAQDEICGRIAEGQTLAEICREEGMPSRRTVYDWIRDDADFAKAMETARDIGADAIAEEALRIADSPLEGVELEIGADGGTKEKRGDMLGHRKLQVETRLKLLAKWHPKKYGEKVTAEHVGANGGAIQYERIERVIVDPEPK
ncbi:helix-turn-helix domain-containing protein [Cupriavidus taiwanensis]|uniref:terminase small subunit-like protein n=1 Tax=Cupriavidus taiwanensis TaxID=164546 RepID=UPI0015739400|nr:helix-turn-helix domain-containing protein [Cupriavidus taiwanensis]NSX16927.1 helix-turn-helix domain-containing protein [Cupriavidus taiwanensis]